MPFSTPEEIAAYTEQLKAERAARRNAKFRTWYAANRDIHKERTARWAAKNRDKTREAYRRWLEKPGNRQKAIEASQRWAERNADRVSKRRKERYQENIDELRLNARERARAKRESDPAKHLADWRMWRYGISQTQFDQMLAEQGFGCAACGEMDPGEKGWHVDHCHASGIVRGILCRKCNLMIGYADHHPEVLQGAMRYLQGNKRKR